MSWFAAFFHWLGTPFRLLLDPEGRKAWAIMMMAGCAVVMTAYVSAVLWLVRMYPRYAFDLGLIGFVMLGIVITGLAALVVKRDIDLHALGLQLKISDQQVEEIANKVIANTLTPPAPPTAPSVIVQTGSPPTA